jgi:hypothetical protein
MLDEDEVAVDSPSCGLSVISPWYDFAEVLDLVQKLFFSLPFEATVVLEVHIFGHKLPDCFGVDVVVCLEESIRECQKLLGLHVICERRSRAELEEIIFGVSRNKIRLVEVLFEFSIGRISEAALCIVAKRVKISMRN